jgi:microcystin-dependent protein
MITPFAGSTAPTGWLLCYGQAVSRTTYAALFAVLSTTYNTGVVAGTDFCLPDLRGRTVAGIDNMGGLDAGVLSIANTPGTTTGAETVALTSAQSGVPAHQHVNTLTNNAVTSGAGSLHQHGNSLTGTTTFASSGHAHNSGNFHAAIGATNGDPSRIGYVAGAVIGPGTATYSIVGSGTLTNSGNFNHYTPVYGDTGGPSATASVGISNAGEQAHTHSVTSNVTISNVNNTAANAAESHSVMQPTMVLNYIVRY